MFDLTPSTLLTNALVLLVAVVVHEFAHAYVAFLMGDKTAYEQGRMTLDPRANVHPWGFLIGVLIGFAILGSAPVNPYRMRNRRLGTFLAVGAGPFSNLIIAAIFAVPIRLGLLALSPSSLGDSIPGFVPSIDRVVFTMVFLNVLLFVFNLLPLYPLDGWTVLLSALPTRPAIWWERNRQTSMYVLFGLIALAFIAPSLARIVPALGYLNILEWLISVPSNFIVRALLWGGM